MIVLFLFGYPFLAELFLSLKLHPEGMLGLTVIKEKLTVAEGFLSNAKLLAFAARMLPVRTNTTTH